MKKVKYIIIINLIIIVIISIFGFCIIREEIKIALGDYSIPISINNESDDWCVIFFPYYSSLDSKESPEKILLPPINNSRTPRYNDSEINKNNRQYYIIHNGSYSLDLYFGRDIDFTRFHLIVYGFPINNNNIDENDIMNNIKEEKIYLLSILHNKKFTGDIEKDDYKGFGIIDIKKDLSR